MRLFAVKNFERFQHYKERKPPWVKLYRDVWRDREFFRLSERSKLLFLGLTTIASITDNRIPEDPDWLAMELGLSAKTIDLNPLVDAGFLLVLQDASNALAECKQDALVETDQRQRREETDHVDDEAVEKSSEPDSISVKELFESWNDICPPLGLAAVRELSASRRQKASARIREHPKLPFWQDVFGQIKRSQFLLGRGPRNGKEPWKVTFDFLIENDVNCLKIAEGRYAQS